MHRCVTPGRIFATGAALPPGVFVQPVPVHGGPRMNNAALPPEDSGPRHRAHLYRSGRIL
ncbi:hypothetical protein CENSYa_1740 [Cenarchaeum symbiosum A]|uniref:Uncharacterized protein n=1 Tax=Cenarchaeum symbiosum (strain A) TaxID=414004 RepID=A0RYD4_CENSY|nr:hypothetical protein CENSYa_1740 [Cenarchaeum symbiosum A]